MDERSRGSVSSRSAIVGGNAYRVYSFSNRQETPLLGTAGLVGKPTQKVSSADRQDRDQAVRDAMAGMGRGRDGRWPWWWRLFGW